MNFDLWGNISSPGYFSHIGSLYLLHDLLRHDVIGPAIVSGCIGVSTGRSDTDAGIGLVTLQSAAGFDSSIRVETQVYGRIATIEFFTTVDDFDNRPFSAFSHRLAEWDRVRSSLGPYTVPDLYAVGVSLFTRETFTREIESSRVDRDRRASMKPTSRGKLHDLHRTVPASLSEFENIQRLSSHMKRDADDCGGVFHVSWEEIYTIVTQSLRAFPGACAGSQTDIGMTSPVARLSIKHRQWIREKMRSGIEGTDR